MDSSYVHIVRKFDFHKMELKKYLNVTEFRYEAIIIILITSLTFLYLFSFLLESSNVQVKK